MSTPVSVKGAVQPGNPGVPSTNQESNPAPPFIPTDLATLGTSGGVPKANPDSQSGTPNGIR